MNISVIIPNYNGAELLNTNLPKVIHSLANYKTGFIELIVSDDASNDNSLEILEKLKVKLDKEKNKIKFKIIKSPFKINSGFSANVNRGVKYATGEFIFLLNSDVIPREGFLEPLLENFSDPLVFGVGCMDESIEKQAIVLRGRGRGYWKKGFLVHNKLDVDNKKTFWVSGGSSLFRKEIWNKIGGLNEIYNPFYWEDIDLSYRAQKAGYKVLFESRSRVIHEHEKGTIKSNFKISEIKTIAYRNQFFFVWLNITDLNLLISHFILLPYNLLRAFLRKDKDFTNGFWQALKRFSYAMEERKKNKKVFKLCDKDILKNFINN